MAGGWGSNRLYAGMERRRKDWSANEGVGICTYVQNLQARGLDPAEVNSALLKRFCGSTRAKTKRWRSLKLAAKKGLAFWKKRLEKVQVGKHGRNKEGGALKRVCLSSEAKGCRAPGGAGRTDLKLTNL